MTNHWVDIKNSDCVLIMGANPADNHPVSFKWISQAKQKGAKVISVDPRFTRTSTQAHIYAPLRAGTDIAFLGGMIHYILSNELYFKPYVAAYTNAGYIVGPNYSFSDGLFSGFDPDKRRYDKASWDFARDAKGVPKQDLSLDDPSCVLQHLKRHYERYTLEEVSQVTGTPPEVLTQVYEAFTATGARDKAGTIMYAMGWTQHTVGVQNIRAMSIIQLLLGNMGIPGGGINALRGESNVQGSTDHCLLFHIWPGYLPVPTADLATLGQYQSAKTPANANPRSANWWQYGPKYMTSLLKAMFGDAAVLDNDFGYGWMPKLDKGRTYAWLDIFDRMHRGEIKGLFAWGQNPACSGANSNKTRQALAKLDWLVTVNLFDNETTSFWKGPGLDPASVATEVFYLPAAASVEKEGSITNSGRWMQWRYRAAAPPGEAKPDGEIMVELWRRLRRRYAAPGAKAPQAITNLRWSWPGRGAYDPHQVAKLINGYFEKDATVKGKKFKRGELVPSFTFLQADGSTSSGNWLYSQSYNADGNQAARRSTKDPTGLGMYPGWAWCWPVNRRVLYNRAGVDPSGAPWSPGKSAIAWQDGKWQGDVPDGGWPPLNDPKGMLPFIMLPNGVGSIFGPRRADGPFPEHYEPMESPAVSNGFSSRRHNPLAISYHTSADALADGGTRFPLVGTTYRVSVHWQTGVLTRWQPWLLECQPQLFVEMSRELARLRGIADGDMCRVSSARGQVEAVAVVTSRLRPLQVQGREVHQVGLPYCFGWVHPKNGGDAANLLTPAVADPNTGIPETKTFMVQVERMRAA
ncbi:MAG: formate dehydrogenase-N subunit alpha [Desulfarculaceae bacterium]|nr:formate dehydrogenase-N subunit alpha [Desulfarculaceae bacterium]